MRDTLWKLYRRRVPHVLGVYLAAGWGLLEFTDWAVARFQPWWDPTPAVLAGLLALLPLVFWGAWRLGAGLPALPAPDPGPRSVAVLPFAVPGGDPDTAYLGFGIADQILADLSRIGGLQVAARTSSFAFRDTAMDVREIGRRLGVRAVLEGSVQKQGDRLRVTTQLIGVEDGYHLWSERWDRTMEDVFQIQDEVARNVARTLNVLLREGDRKPLGRAPTGEIRAYEAYLRGREYLANQKRTNLEYARTMFRRARVLDPGFALAHTGLAEATAILCMYYPAVARTDLEEASDAAERALELEPDLPEAFAALGAVRFLQGRLDEAEGAFREAEERQPGLLDAWYLHGRVAFQQGRFPEAARLFRRAEGVRPDAASAFFAAQALQAAGRQEEASEAFAHAARVALEHLELHPDHARAATMAAVALCRTGREEEGLQWARRALAADPEDAGVRYNVACLYAIAGRTGEALGCIEEARAMGFGNREWLERDPDLDGIRDEPRFRAVLETM